MSYIPRAITSYRMAFAYSDLVNGSLTVNHKLSEQFPAVQVWSNTKERVQPDTITSMDSNNIRISFDSYGNIVGNWMVVILK